MYLPPEHDIIALLSPTLAVKQRSSTKSVTIAQEPLLSNMLCRPAENFSTVSKKYCSLFQNPFTIACLGFVGNSGSRMIN